MCCSTVYTNFSSVSLIDQKPVFSRTALAYNTLQHWPFFNDITKVQVFNHDTICIVLAFSRYLVLYGHFEKYSNNSLLILPISYILRSTLPLKLFMKCCCTSVIFNNHSKIDQIFQINRTLYHFAHDFIKC